MKCENQIEYLNKQIQPLKKNIEHSKIDLPCVHDETQVDTNVHVAF